MKTPVMIVLVLPLLLAFRACDREEVGPCLHVNREALFHVESAGDTQTGTPITPIVIKDVVFDGSPASGVLLVTALSSNVDFVQGELVCNVPCFFGEEPGFYQFRVGAEGYVYEVHELSAAYAISEGDCPSFREGPVRLNFGLRRE